MKRIFLTLATISVLLFNNAKAGTYTEDIEIKSVKGTRYENLIQVDIKSTKVDTYTIKLIDHEGFELYSERFVGVKYCKKFSLAIERVDLSNKITVLIISKSTGEVSEQVFVPSDILRY